MIAGPGMTLIPVRQIVGSTRYDPDCAHAFLLGQMAIMTAARDLARRTSVGWPSSCVPFIDRGLSTGSASKLARRDHTTTISP